MDQATRLYVLTPVFEEISRCYLRVWALIGNLDIYYEEHPSDRDVENALESLFSKPEGYDSSWVSFRRLFVLLGDRRLEAVGYGELADVARFSVVVFAKPDSPQESSDAAVSLIQCHDEHFAWLRTQRETHFGFWGNRFLEYFTEGASDEELRRFTKIYADAKAFFEEEPELNVASSSQVVPVVVNESMFSVTLRGNQCCVLGNTKLFRFLKAIASYPNRYLQHYQIVELMGEDSFDMSQVKVWKRRLCDRLEDSHCSDLVKAIKAQKGAYALMLRERGMEVHICRNETEMQPE